MSIITADMHCRGQTFYLSLTDLLELHLSENPTTGFRWKTVTIDSQILEEGEHGYAPLVADDLALGAAQTRIMRYHPIAEGVSPLMLILRQEWKPDQPIDQFRLSVIVSK